MTEFIPGKQYHNFLLVDKRRMDSLHSDVYLFKHVRLGCKALAIKNSDSNKTFCVSFNTIPEDSTGVAHILEHSVLMGSSKYPVKDVFGEIHKGGLMTFLNAMTGSDTTWYPYATRNITEYFNIMDVYCDVVFNPLLLKTTFEQEGWHYHLEEADQDIQFSGVVFNEMKGAFSDPIRALFHNTFEGLLPGSTYSHESGGDPAYIPDLTYEAFVDFHKSHYHPSNCTLFFYGDADLEQELQYVEDNFLQAFDTQVDPAVIATGTVIDQPVFIDDTYPVQPDADLKNKTYLAVSSLIGTVDERTKNTAFQIIAHILFNSDASPLKNAITEAGLCKDFGGVFLANSAHRTVMMTYLVGADPEQCKPFQDLYKTTLEEMVQKGLDQELVLAELNKFEFNLREEMNKAQRGLDLIGKALPAMKYGMDPFDPLDLNPILRDIREKVAQGGYFEKLVQEYLLDNQATATVMLRPDPERLIANRQREQNRLQNYTKQMSAEERSSLVLRTQELTALQATATDQATLDLLPSLTIDDLDPTPPIHKAATYTIDNTPLLVSDLPTNSICYIDFGFDCSKLPLNVLPYLDLFGVLITELGTTTLDYKQFAKQINTYTGGFSHSFNTYLNKEQAKPLSPILWLSLKTLSTNLDRSLALISEVIRDLDLSNRKRIAEIVQREFAWAEHSVQSEGYTLATSRVFSHLSTAGKYNEYVNGAYAYLNLKQLAQSYTENEGQFLSALETIRCTILHRQGLFMNITAETDDISRFQRAVPSVLDALSDNGITPDSSDQFTSFPATQAFCTSSEIVYNVQGCSLFQQNDAYHGSFEVLKTWISRDYLWNTVRQMGGAYGCFVQFNHLTGNFGLVSYRDPQVDKTYAAYDDLQRAIEQVKLTPDALSQLIIGTYGTFTPHQGPAAKGINARNDFLNGVSVDFKQKRIQEILSTTKEDLLQYAPLFSRLRDESVKVTIGNEAKIKGADIVFDDTLAL
ncbi:insulinase family protein [Desulfogranum japonicum]|uniref:insulinase family protein n=1 Tax=Desulfogranum japonicum TaxID=231447 RepID=UPI0004181825|nr:insulinase family protein [Desulfogranum japonicum]